MLRPVTKFAKWIGGRNSVLVASRPLTTVWEVSARLVTRIFQYFRGPGREPVPVIARLLLEAMATFALPQSYGWFYLIVLAWGVILTVNCFVLAFALVVARARGSSSYDRFGAIYLCCTFALFIVLFSSFYFHLSHYDPKSFSGEEPMSVITAIYFSVVTLSTTGFGDFVPKTDIARLAVTVEIVFAMLFTVLVFSVIGTLIAQPRRKSDDGSVNRE